MARRLKELQDGILERQAYNEIPPRVEYNLTPKGQELVESVISFLQWMRKRSKVFFVRCFFKPSLILSTTCESFPMLFMIIASERGTCFDRNKFISVI
jgi:HxlR-like helix-turn-helix protein